MSQCHSAFSQISLKLFVIFLLCRLKSYFLSLRLVVEAGSAVGLVSECVSVCPNSNLNILKTRWLDKLV